MFGNKHHTPYDATPLGLNCGGEPVTRGSGVPQSRAN